MKKYSKEDVIFLESLMKIGLSNDLCGCINDIRRSIFEEPIAGEQVDMKKERLESIDKANSGIGVDTTETNKVFRFIPHEEVEEAKKNAYKEWAWAFDYLRDK